MVTVTIMLTIWLLNVPGTVVNQVYTFWQLREAISSEFAEMVNNLLLIVETFISGVLSQKQVIFVSSYIFYILIGYGQGLCRFNVI